VNAVRRHAVLTALSFVIGVLLVAWTQPTGDGATFLVASVVLVFNAVGALLGGALARRAAKRDGSARCLAWLAMILTLSLPVISCSQHDSAGNAATATGVSPSPAPWWAFQAGHAPGPGRHAHGGGHMAPMAPGIPSPPVADYAHAAPSKGPSGAGAGGSPGKGAGSAGAASAGMAGAAGRPQADVAFPATPPPGAVSPERLRPARTFLRAQDIPPPGVGAYGVFALRALPTPATHDRLLMACRAFLATLPKQSALPASVPLRDQMLTVWPIDDPKEAAAHDEDCDYLERHYDLYGGISAIEDAESQRHKLEGRGPFLIGWSPSTMRGVPDAVVLIIDMSEYSDQRDFDDALDLWQRRIVDDPSLWRDGFTLEGLRIRVRNFANSYGGAILRGIKFWTKTG